MTTKSNGPSPATFLLLLMVALGLMAAIKIGLHENPIALPTWQWVSVITAVLFSIIGMACISCYNSIPDADVGKVFRLL